MSEAITRAHILSNGSYSLLVTPGGNGYAALSGFALTAWQPDPTAYSGGLVCYIRDLEAGTYWSTTQLPCVREHTVGLARAQNHRVEQRVIHADIEAQCQIFVAARLNAEVRRIRIANNGRRPHSLDLTTFAELALNTPGAYAAHPAFAKLFVQTAYDSQRKALIAWRRQRSPDDAPLWVAHRLIAPDRLEYETDRARFIGRTRSAADPQALCVSHPLSGTVGTVLDPAFCMRAAFVLAPHTGQEFTSLLYAAASRAELEAMLDAELPGECGSAPAAAALNALGLPERWRAGISLSEFDYRWEGDVAQSDRPPGAHADYGAFSEDGTEYMLTVGASNRPTPQPWINVIANERFGCLISETGAGYTWAENSRENRITPWSNDAVSDPHTEALYVRDRDSGSFFSAFPGPMPSRSDYTVRHGFGYSRFTTRVDDVAVDTRVFVPRGDSVRILRVSLTNRSGRERRLSVTSYAQLVLGTGVAETRASVETAYDEQLGVIFARNAQRGEFSQRVAFARAVAGTQNVRREATGSRAAFIGPQGSVAAPESLARGSCEARFGDGLDPCAVVQVEIAIAAHQTIELAFLLGEASDGTQARACIERYSHLTTIDAAFREVTEYWRALLSRIHVTTPVRAFDLMLNGWLSYQNLACRMWARSAFYQSGGAFGYRDQLQDSSALLYLDRQITRQQILLHAAHQFVEGDVLHWWHPPTSKGIRTRFSDDLLWLPYITAFYIGATGDRALLDESAPYVSAQPLEPGDDEIFVWPKVAGRHDTLYEHCCKTIDRSLTRGAHGLPLMGVGDWNDGMNRVGREGRGESVWLGFFLFDILHRFVPYCAQRGDGERVQRYRSYRSSLAAALNDGGWDGEWYRRAYYDDGAPLGSAQSDECKIDTLAQAWAVLSRAAPAERAKRAIAAMTERLVSERDGIIRLLTPAFDETPHDPGYIKGYVPGVRENGGQYTHAAVWAVRALAELNDRTHAAELAEMLTPVSHTRTPEQVEVYKGEPYVVAADVYGVAPHTGRAGWTWYTGSAGWLYRVILESILGFTIENGNTIRLRPCIPPAWPGYKLRHRFPSGTTYTLTIDQQGATTNVSAGAVQDGSVVIPVDDDGAHHDVHIRLGPDVGPAYQPRRQESTAP